MQDWTSVARPRTSVWSMVKVLWWWRAIPMFCQAAKAALCWPGVGAAGDAADTAAAEYVKVF